MDKKKKKKKGKDQIQGQWDKLFEKGIPQLICDPPTLSSNTNTNTYVRFFLLTNLLASYHEHPNLMDIKLGTFTPPYHIIHDTERHKRHSKKYSIKTTSHSLGLRICGRRCWITNTRNQEEEDQKEEDQKEEDQKEEIPKDQGQFDIKDKYWGRELQPSTLFQDGLLFFFLPSLHANTNPDNYHIDHMLCSQVLTQVEELRNVLLLYPNINFYSISLLILYEIKTNKTESTEDMDTAHNPTTSVRASLTLIDFAHVELVDEMSREQEEIPSTSLPSYTEGLMLGLNNLEKGVQHIDTFIQQRQTWLQMQETIESAKLTHKTYPFSQNEVEIDA